jgi:hypothetical protein
MTPVSLTILPKLPEPVVIAVGLRQSISEIPVVRVLLGMMNCSRTPGA